MEEDLTEVVGKLKSKLASIDAENAFGMKRLIMDVLDVIEVLCERKNDD